ncbi:MAG: PEP-CTERM sorting domain-containing protein [Gemmatales bacterium]
MREVLDTGAASTSFLLATADTNTVFRGVALTVAVPEPTTYALIGMTGIVGAGVWFQRRRKLQTARFARI